MKTGPVKTHLPRNPPAPTVQPEPTKQEDPPEPPNDAPFVVVKRKKNPNQRTRANKTTNKVRTKPAAVLVKVSDQTTYADTLRVRSTDIDFAAMGTRVTAVRKTQKGDLLVELTKGAKAIEATTAIRDKLAGQIPGLIVSRLRHTTEVEIVDLDEVATKDEILYALQAALYGDDSPITDAVKVTGLWATRDGRQMATAIVPASDSSKLTRIRVGWTQCRVRPRRPEPERCHRCHGFGHSTRKCTGSDLSATCRRCGLTGHIQSTCTAGDDKCVACDRIKATRVPHKPGSSACSARRKAIAEMHVTSTMK